MTYSSEILADSPVVWYRQGESSGTSMIDSSGNGRNGSYLAAPTFGATGATSDGDTANSYNGTSQYGEAPTGSAADTALKAIAGPFTVECWVNPSTVSGTRTMVDRYANGFSGTSAWLFYIVSGNPRFIIRNSAEGDSILSATGTLTVGTWYHIVGTFDGSTMRIYINGSLNASLGSVTPATNFQSRTPNLTVAAWATFGNYFGGKLDEVAIYGTALSATRVSAHYNAATATGSPASGTASLSLSASGTAEATSAGTASLSLSASGSTGATASGTASLNLSATGDTVAPSPAAGTASLNLSATVDVSASPAGAASLALLATAAAEAILAASGTATLNLSAFGSAVMTSGGTAYLNLTAGGEAIAVYETDTSNAFDGLDLLLTATVIFAVPVATPPAPLPERYDVAIPYPVPVMVDGRPT